MSERVAVTGARRSLHSPRVAGLMMSLLLVLMGAQPVLASNYESDPQQEAERRYRLEPGTFVYGTGFVAPLAELFGEIYVGDDIFVAANSILRAAPTRQIVVGAGSSVQDNVIIRALEDSIAIGDNSTITHHAIVRNSQIGSAVYLGYHATLTDARVGDGAVIWHGARVEGVNIPRNAFVGAGEVITSQSQANALPKVPAEDKEYTNRRLQSNQAFARGYINLYQTEGYEAVIGLSRNPKTPILPQTTEPRISPDVEMQEFVRIVGDVRVGRNSSIGQRTTIRADEGSPIVIGAGADIDDRVTFHGLEGTDVHIGDDLTVEDDAVIHGPLVIGNNVTVDEGAVVFNATVGDNVKIGNHAIISTPPGEDSRIVIPANSEVPDGTVITGPEDLKKLRPRKSGDRDDMPGDLPATGAGGLSTSRAAELGAIRAPYTVTGRPTW